MRDHWQSGFDNMHRMLEHRHYFERPPVEVGVVTHDIHREDCGEPGARHVAIEDGRDHLRCGVRHARDLVLDLHDPVVHHD
jgi:hypothetical protein